MYTRTTSACEGAHGGLFHLLCSKIVFVRVCCFAPSLQTSFYQWLAAISNIFQDYPETSNRNPMGSQRQPVGSPRNPAKPAGHTPGTPREPRDPLLGNLGSPNRPCGTPWDDHGMPRYFLRSTAVLASFYSSGFQVCSREVSNGITWASTTFPTGYCVPYSKTEVDLYVVLADFVKFDFIFSLLTGTTDGERPFSLRFI